MGNSESEIIRKAVRETYGRTAQSKAAGCSCSASCCGKSDNTLEMAEILGYSGDDVNAVPQGANLGLGCGNPHIMAGIREGETVLDLGSGGGFDCFLASKKAGQSGHVIGVDMTPEMISKAKENAKKGGYSNVEFRSGEIEDLPVEDESVDVIISNCVINLSSDKQRVFTETFRVLKKGGRLAVSDVVAMVEIPEEVKSDMALYTGCIAGAANVDEIKLMLKNAGFEQIRIAPKDESKAFIREWAPQNPITDYVVSASIEAVKPAS